MCCPEHWTCLSNALCYYGAENYLGRYSCTDQDWGSSCATFCIDDSKCRHERILPSVHADVRVTDGSAGGNQAVLQCDDGRYCCDGNRVSFNCCDNGSDRFDLPSNGSVATSMNTPESSNAATASSPQTSTFSTQTSASSSSDGVTAIVGPPVEASRTKATTTRSTTHVVTSVTSVTASSVVSYAGNSPTTVVITYVSTAISTPGPVSAASGPTQGASQSSKSHNIGEIVGLAVGIPVGVSGTTVSDKAPSDADALSGLQITLFAVRLAVFLIRRRRRHRLAQHENGGTAVTNANDKGSFDDSPNTPELAGGAHPSRPDHVRGPPEIDSRAVRPEAAEMNAEPRTPRNASWKPHSPSTKELVADPMVSHDGQGPYHRFAELPG